MLIRRVLVVAAVASVAAAIVLIAAIVGDWGTAAILIPSIVLSVVVVLAAGVVAASKVVRLLLSTRHYARLSSERTAAIRPAVSQVSASLQEYARLARGRNAARGKASFDEAGVSDRSGILVVALGESVDSDVLERFIRANARSGIVLATDRADVVSRLAKEVDVEFLPAVTGGETSRIGQLAARLVELAVENEASTLIVWPDDDRAIPLAGADATDLTLIGGEVLRSLLQVDSEVRRRLDEPPHLFASLASKIDALGRNSDQQLQRAVRELRGSVDHSGDIPDATGGSEATGSATRSRTRSRVPTNVFVLGTGRCGSVAFAEACAHLSNFTSGHETRARLVGSDRLDYPQQHIEVDHRLSWFVGPLTQRFDDRQTLYVHLLRDRDSVVDSWVRRWDSPFRASLIRAFGHGIVMRTEDWTDTDIRTVCEAYVDTVRANVDEFISRRDGIRIAIEDCDTEFPHFAHRIGASGDLDAAIAEFGRRHNASEP